MYSNIADLLKDNDENIIKDFVNDENRTKSLIVLDATDPNYDANDVAVLRIDEQITAADDEIDSYLRGRYDLPLASVPGRIKQISKDIAIYNLYKRRQRDSMPDSIVSIYKERLKELEKIRSGKIDLGIESTEVKSSSGIFRTNKKSTDKMFPTSTLDNY